MSSGGEARGVRGRTSRRGATRSSRPAPIGNRHSGRGFFGPQSRLWQVHREGVLLLAGPRALLLQLAHPLVAEGVAEHSDFLRDPLGRLWRTIDTTLGLVFGTRADATARSERLRAVHARVTGQLREATACFPAGTRYCALDPPLLLWVHATLVDSALLAYQIFVRRLETQERCAYYDETRLLASLCGIPDAHVPPDLRTFRRYLHGMLAGPELEVTPTARRLAAAVLRPPRPLWLRSASIPAGAVTRGLLPRRVRQIYGLEPSGVSRRVQHLGRAAVRTALPWLPPALRLFPDARRALAGAGL